MAIKSKLDLLLGDVMTRQPHFLSPLDQVDRAERLCKANNIHHLPVVDVYGKVVGILSQSDLLKISYGISLFRNRDPDQFNRMLFKSVLVKDVMTREVTTLRSDDTLADALAIFEENRFHAIPIIENDRLIGIITPIDLLKASLYPPK